MSVENEALAETWRDDPRNKMPAPPKRDSGMGAAAIVVILIIVAALILCGPIFIGVMQMGN